MNEQAKKQRVRSPAYPAYSLGQCVEYLEAMKRKNGFAEVPKTMGLRQMGLDTTKNDAFRAASALTGFGLLEESGAGKDKSLKISDLGKTILIMKPESGERNRALQQAARNYPIIRTLNNKWSEGLPSDDVIKLELLKQGFNERAIDPFAPILRETYDFAKLGGGAIIDEGISEESMSSEPSVQSETKPRQVTATPKGYVGYTLTLSKGKEVRLTASEGLSPEDVDFMFQWMKRLDLTRKDSSAEQDQSE